MTDRTTLLKLIQREVEQADGVDFVDRHRNRVVLTTTLDQVGIPPNLSRKVGEMNGRITAGSGKNRYEIRVSPQ